MLELYHNAMSVCAQKVRVALAEKDIPYTGHPLDIRAGEARTPAYLALNPNGVVPTLVVNGVPIIESTIICEFLDDAFPDSPLRPADPLALSTMRWWTIKPDAGLHKAFGLLSFAVAFRHQNTTTQFANRARSEAVLDLMSVIDHGLDSPAIELRIGAVRKLLAEMTARLADHDWLVADAFSLADIAMLPYVCRLRDLNQAWLWADGGPHAAVGRWLDRCYAKRGYAGIADFLDPKYLAVMAAKGLEAQPRLRAMLAA